MKALTGRGQFYKLIGTASVGIALVLNVLPQTGTPAESDGVLLVSPSAFRRLGTNIAYKGEECAPGGSIDKPVADHGEVIRVGEYAYYESHLFYRAGRDDGFVVENLAKRTCRLYPMFGLAEAVKLFKRSEYCCGAPNATNGLYRVGNTLWMGSNGIGIVAFDLNRRTWSRYDVKSNAVPGDHAVLIYADDNYAVVMRGEFPGASVHLYSVKNKKWLGMKAVSTKVVSEYGYTTGLVQVGVNHRFFANQKYIPIDWTFMGLRVVDKGDSYLFEKRFSESKTVFEISKSQFEHVFAKGSHRKR